MLETVTLPAGIEFETVTSCDLCGADEFAVFDRVRSNTLSQCKRCGLVFTNPRIADSSVKDKVLYSAAYFQQKSRMTEKLVNARKQSYKLEIAALTEFKSGGSILDVGCGMGIFLDTFSSSWEKYGCDVSSYALDEAKSRGITVFHGEFEKLEFESRTFDVVYFRASLHHAYAPNACLKRAFSLLKPGGIVAITMSNNESGPGGLFFKGHVKSYEQAHNYLFSKKTLFAYLRRNGFKVIRSVCPYFGTGYESIRDFAEFAPLLLKLWHLRLTRQENNSSYYDFASPPMYGNYINIYAQKSVGA